MQKNANNLDLENAESCINLNYVDDLLYQDQVEDALIKISNLPDLTI